MNKENNMISKKQFVKTINFLEESKKRVLKIDDLLGSDFVFDIVCDYEETIVRCLSDALNDVDYISWWIYECEYGQINTNVWTKHENGEETVDNLDTVEKLYDFLLNELKDKQNDKN